MSPLGTGRRVEELARLLEGAVAGPSSVTAGGAVLAGRLRTLGPALSAVTAPRPEFRAALRARLVAVATVQAATATTAAAAAPRTPTRVSAPLLQRRLGATAGAMAGVVAVAGIGIASSRSLPGQAFYGLKRGAEAVELDLASGPVAKGSKHLEFAATRLREVEALAHGASELSLGTLPTAAGPALGGSRVDRLRATLAAMDRETRDGQRLLESAYRRSGRSEPLRLLTTFATSQRAGLSWVLPSLPLAAQSSARSSLSLVTRVGSDAQHLLALGTCTDGCNPATGGPRLSGEPVPGATAGPSDPGNGVGSCVCSTPGAGEPAPTTAPTPEPSPSDAGPSTSGGPRSPAPSPSPTPRPSSTSGPGAPLPTPSSTPLPTLLPTPWPTPTLPPLLPSPLGNLVPGLPTGPVTSLAGLVPVVPTLLP